MIKIKGIILFGIRWLIFLFSLVSTLYLTGYFSEPSILFNIENGTIDRNYLVFILIFIALFICSCGGYIFKWTRKSKKIFILLIVVQIIIILLTMRLLHWDYEALCYPYEIVGNSMQPTLKDKQLIYIYEPINLSQLKRSDIVVVRKSKDKDIVKRIIGLPNENISIKDGKVFINGTILNEKYLKNSEFTPISSSDYHDVNLDSNSFFLMGDNRSHSEDSRYFGQVKFNQIIGFVDRTPEDGCSVYH